ncbi:MAG: patatin-like phospholipase family protein [Hyphococcus sp.]
MKTIRDRLTALPFFQDLERRTLDDLAARGDWLSLAGGWELFRQDTPSSALHFNLSGRLIVVRTSPEGEEQVLGYVRAGEPVGEMSLLSGEAHTASVFALRDTEILSLQRDDVEALIHDHGEFAGALTRIILSRSRHPGASFQQSSPRVFALIGSSPSIDINARAKDLATRISRYGLRAAWLPVGDGAPQDRAFEEAESGNDILLVAAKVDGSAWYRFALRHADRFVVFARRDARPSVPFPLAMETGARAKKFRLVDLVMLHEGAPACPVTEWSDAIDAARVINCRSESCVERLARIIAGKSVGLVLSGGGARAYAHIGAVKALREAGVPIDFVSGASMGGIVAACVAMGWSDEEIEERIRDGFVESNPLGDHVLPVVALTKGARVEERLFKHFGDVRIEDLRLPYYCVSSDLVLGEPRVHRSGLLRDALRASIALPGILPPVIEGGALLVDGAVTNNFPTDIMATMHRGLTIGIDVARRGAIDIEAFRDPPTFFGWVAQHGFSAAPPIVSLLMRTATARHERMRQVHPADIMIAPPVEGVELRDWKKYDLAVREGYNAAKAAIDERWYTLNAIASGGGY